MAESIEILLEIVEPILIDLHTSPIYHIGTAQIGPKGYDGREIELRVEGSILQWRYTNETDWIILLDLDLGQVNFEALEAIGDVGSGSDQLARGNHDHEIGNMALFFENKLL